MNEDALSGDELNRAIAEAMGWEQREVATVDPKNSGSPPNGKIPPFDTSLDALSAGPERLARERGWQSFHSEIDGVTHWGWRRGAATVAADGATQVEARALAALRVLATAHDEQS
jgi:hypothetical protein